MARPHKALFAGVLRNLGHPVPTEADLDAALRKAIEELKTAEGLDPKKVKYKVALTQVDADWVKSTF